MRFSPFRSIFENITVFVGILPINFTGKLFSLDFVYIKMRILHSQEIKLYFIRRQKDEKRINYVLASNVSNILTINFYQRSIRTQGFILIS